MARRTALILASLALGLGTAATLRFAMAQPTAVDEFAPRKKIQSRGVDLEFTNLSKVGGRWAVSGAGVLPLRMDITEEGEWPAPRRLQVLVAIFTRPDPNSLKPGERFFLKAHPEILSMESGEARFEWDIPLLPGDYVAQVLICDPDKPFRQPQSHLVPHLNSEEFPGLIRRARTIGVHIDPVE